MVFSQGVGINIRNSFTSAKALNARTHNLTNWSALISRFDVSASHPYCSVLVLQNAGHGRSDIRKGGEAPIDQVLQAALGSDPQGSIVRRQ